MLLLRSAFWLTLAFYVLHPVGPDLGAMADSAKNTAIATARAAVAEGSKGVVCETWECAGGKVMVTATIGRTQPPVQAAPMPPRLSTDAIPFPKPRLNRAS